MEVKYDTQEILKSSIENINTLKEHLAKIDELRNEIQTTIKEAEELPKQFNQLVVKLDDSTNNFIQTNQELLKEQIISFQRNLNELSSRIRQIDEIDFSSKFEVSKNIFFEELSTSKKGLDNVVNNLKTIDLEAHFYKHDKTLSEIFVSINNISTSLISLSNQLNSLINKLNEIDNRIGTVQNIVTTLDLKISEINKNFETFSKKSNTFNSIIISLIIVTIITIILLKFI